jgi:hypothetical protein
MAEQDRDSGPEATGQSGDATQETPCERARADSNGAAPPRPRKTGFLAAVQAFRPPPVPLGGSTRSARSKSDDHDAPKAVKDIWRKPGCEWDTLLIESFDASEVAAAERALRGAADLEAAHAMLEQNPSLAQHPTLKPLVFAAWGDRVWGTKIRGLTAVRFREFHLVLAWLMQPRQRARFRAIHKAYGGTEEETEHLLTSFFWSFTTRSLPAVSKPKALEPARPRVHFRAWIFWCWWRFCRQPVRELGSSLVPLTRTTLRCLESPSGGPDVVLWGRPIRASTDNSIPQIHLRITESGARGAARCAVRLNDDDELHGAVPARGCYAIPDTKLLLRFSDSQYREGDCWSWRAEVIAHSLEDRAWQPPAAEDGPIRRCSATPATLPIPELLALLVGHEPGAEFPLDDVMMLFERQPKLGELLLAVDRLGLTSCEGAAVWVDDRWSHRDASPWLSRLAWVELLRILSQPDCARVVDALVHAGLEPQRAAVWLLREKFLLDRSPDEVSRRTGLYKPRIAYLLHDARAAIIEAAELIHQLEVT